MQHDYCFYFDVDMRIDSVVGEEVLGDLVSTKHFYKLLKNQSILVMREIQIH